MEKPLTVAEDENHVRITGEETEIIFDKKTGEFTRYQAKSVSFMTGGKDEFYRAPTGIDEGTHESDYDDIWRAEGLDRLKRKYSQYRLSVPKIRCFLKCRLPIPRSRTTQYSLPLILCIASAVREWS